MAENNQVQMPRVKLGTQGLEVSRMGFGCAGLTGVYNVPLSNEAGISVIKHAFDQGITFFDSSDLYALGKNELMVGEALKLLPREKIQLATKFGVTVAEDGQVGVKGTPEYVRECCEASLKRLDVDYIDLYYQHRVDVSVPIEDTMGELKKLVEEGKVKYIGLSEASFDTIKRAHAVHPITALQMEYSLWTREMEDNIIPLCRELGIGIVAYSPLGRGFFGGRAVVEGIPSQSSLLPTAAIEDLGSWTKSISNAKVQIPRFTGENLEKNKFLFERVSKLAEKHGCTPPQLALAWLLHQGDHDIVPIPGTTKIKNLNDNIESLGVKLTEEEVKEISEAFPVDEASGEREMTIFTQFCWKYADTPPQV